MYTSIPCSWQYGDSVFVVSLKCGSPLNSADRLSNPFVRLSHPANPADANAAKAIKTGLANLLGVSVDMF